MELKQLYLFLFIILPCNFVFAEQMQPNILSANMLICQDNGTNLDYCGVQQDPIFTGFNAEMTFNIHYVYSCIGHELFLAFQTNEGNQNITFPKV
jgi:hypothetical protein